ncbi:hypothetical protein SEUCBS140593_002267 [Sporothrix eucalyptigena]|uniref:Phospholipase/carboxylesterase/thioesterase domain-containing protein n=1 Tax=Sporothrix eucalyptigena TaxID=1812306 RepID=A0ABP0B564_9PEZI
MTITDPPEKSFGAIHVVEPKAGHTHTHTAILLHGRGSTGEEFAEELFETFLSPDKGTSLPNDQRPTLADKLPTWRWVFPSSPSTWNATFKEWMPAWFEAHSLADPTLRQDLQMPGLRASVQHVEQIIDEEIKILRGAGYASDAHAHLVFGGISLGGAVALWTLLSTKTPEQPLACFAVASTWLPFAKEVEAYLVADKASVEYEEQGFKFVQSMMAPLHQSMRQRKEQQTATADAASSVLKAPVFVGHGRDDAYVDIELGQQVQQVLTAVGFTVEWNEYEGAEQEGHWIKEPEEMDDLRKFFAAVVNR